MPSPNVDLVIVLDTSESMAPCFKALTDHLADISAPMQGFVAKTRYGLVTTSVGKGEKSTVHHIGGLGRNSMLDVLYGSARNDPAFTDDPAELKSVLAALEPRGDEDMLLALDCALDFPFGPLSDTKRVIAMFSDEPLEQNASTPDKTGKIPLLIEKIQARRVQLFMALPLSPASEELAAADRSELEQVDGGDGLAGVNFKLLLQQMGKSISSASLQSSKEPPYTRALFGQDQWGKGVGTFEGLR